MIKPIQLIMRPAVPVKYKSFALTVRPRDGATSAHDDLLCKFVRKQCDYYYIISEKLDDERHLHCGIFLKKAVKRADFTTVIKRVFKAFDDEEKRVLNQGVKIMYNYDFIQNYLDKDDDTEVILKNLPEESHLESYWPPSKEQEKAKAKAAVDKYYANLEYLWFQHQPVAHEVNYHECAKFLSDLMYNKRLIRVMRDDKAIAQCAKHLSRYIRKDSTYVPELAPWESVL